MAASKFTTWVYVQCLNDKLSIVTRYAVYADMNDGNVQPYVRMTDCQLYGDTRAYLSARVPATVKVQINGTGTTYSCSTGSYIRNWNEGPDYLEEPLTPDVCVIYSSSTNVPIKKNGEAFNFKVTVSMRNGESYTITQPASGTVSQTINGPATINTGAIATYTFGRTVVANDTYYVAPWLSCNLSSQNPYNQYPRYHEGYISPYEAIDYASGNISSVSFAPLRASYDNLSSVSGKVYLQYYQYIPSKYFLGDGFTNYIVVWSENVGDNSSYGNRTGLYHEKKGGLCLSAVSKTVTVKSRTTVDAVLKPAFKKLEYFVYPPANTRNIYINYYQTMMDKYGGIVQGSKSGRVTAYFDADERNILRNRGVSGGRLKYGDQFRSGTFSDNLSGSMRTYTLLYGVNDQDPLTEIRAKWDFREFTTAGANRTIKFSLVDDFGFTTDITDTITVLPYGKPRIDSYNTQRCSVATSTDDTGADDIYTYEGVTYKLDNTGEYAVVEWKINISSLNNKNSRSLRWRLSSAGTTNITYGDWNSINLNSYTASGFFVVRVDPENSYNVQFELSDDFYSHEYYIAPINTAYAMLDFKRGGTGVAMGKVSELDYVYDIHRNWTLRMPYDTLIQNYSGNGSAVRLYDWMQRTMQRIAAIEAKRDVPVFMWSAGSDSTRWAENNSSICIPSGYGVIDGESTVVPNEVSKAARTAAWMNNNGITITRPYLNITLGRCYSYAGRDSTGIRYRPTIYLFTTKPITINQSNGVPNGSPIMQRTFSIPGPMESTIPDQRGTVWYTYYEWDTRNGPRYHDGQVIYNYSFDMSSYQNQQVWIVVTCTSYLESTDVSIYSGDWGTSVSTIWQSNTHV